MPFTKEDYDEIMEDRITKGMEAEVLQGKSLDVTKIGKEIEPGLYRLAKFVDGGYDYIDPKRRVRIVSIGVRSTPTNLLGEKVEILASTSAEFYMHPEFECVWLR